MSAISKTGGGVLSNTLANGLKDEQERTDYGTKAIRKRPPKLNRTSDRVVAITGKERTKDRVGVGRGGGGEVGGGGGGGGQAAGGEGRGRKTSFHSTQHTAHNTQLQQGQVKNTTINQHDCTSLSSSPAYPFNPKEEVSTEWRDLLQNCILYFLSH